MAVVTAALAASVPTLGVLLLALALAAMRRDPKPLPPPPTPMPSPMPVPYGHPRETAAGMQSDRR